MTHIYDSFQTWLTCHDSMPKNSMLLTMASDDGEFVKRISPDWHIYADYYEQNRTVAD